MNKNKAGKENAVNENKSQKENSTDNKKYIEEIFKKHKSGKKKIDLVFPILHGPYGEDGKLQGALDILNVPYVFSGVLEHALAMNKPKTKIIVKNLGIPVSKDLVLSFGEKYNSKEIIKQIGLPLIIKPSELGSSVGISKISEKKYFKKALSKAFETSSEIMVEKFIKGRELTVAVMGNNPAKALPVVEIIPKISEWFDYKAKYEANGSEEVCSADIPKHIEKLIQEYAIKIYKDIGCYDMARCDFIWSSRNKKIYFLEINTIPGMTPTSLAPLAAFKKGLSFSRFLDEIIKNAIKRNSLF